MKTTLLLLGVLLTLILPTQAESYATDIAIYNRILASADPRTNTVQMGDMILPVATVRMWRDVLVTQAAGGFGKQSATQSGINTWTNGNVYYTFNPAAGSTVSPAHQKKFRDACAEWATFANLQFIESDTQPNRILVSDAGTGLDGGTSNVGMIGDVQSLSVGTNAWNRQTIVHELGHALGLVHEHQRSDRDNHVNILTANIASGFEGDFAIIPTSMSNGPYDFLSVMHYSKNLFSTNTSLDTIEPLPAYSQYVNVMGLALDRVLSRGDRDGMAIMYGNGPALSLVVANTADSGPGSLRAAIYHALDQETDNPGSGATVTFQIPTANPTGVSTIAVTAQLPAPGPNTTIDGTTEASFLGASAGGAPLIVLSGALAQPPDTYGCGLRLVEHGCSIKALAIAGFSQQGIVLTGSNATGNSIAACYIGLLPDGITGTANAFAGVEAFSGANGNSIGVAGAGNVISGNTVQGVAIHDAGTTGNLVLGNWIGLNGTGSAAIPNTNLGIQIYAGAAGNRIGGTTPGERNVISGNTHQGIYIADAGTTGNVIEGNYVGTDPAGNAAIPNTYSGVAIYGSASGNTIGGAASGAGNLISGNTNQGITIGGAGTNLNVIAGNYIGTNAAGTGPLPNAYEGVAINGGAQSNVVGGGVPGARNVISGNNTQGATINGAGTNLNVIEGNYIGTNAAGTATLPNKYAGVQVSTGAQNNTIGGTLPGARNVISGNASQGIFLAGAAVSGNTVEGNYLGINAVGSAAVPNGFAGVEINGGASSNTIGGTAPGSGNVISGNTFQGVYINSGAFGNKIEGNLVGLDASGANAVANNLRGVEIAGGTGNFIGNSSGGRNYISGNKDYGVVLDQVGTTGNTVEGNTIGLNVNGSPVGNVAGGIAVFRSPTSNTIGGSGAGQSNLISGNGGPGVGVYDAGSRGNAISENAIYGNTSADLYNPGGAPFPSKPIISSAVLGLGTAVTGTFGGAANNTYTIEFFAAQSQYAKGSGGGQYFVGSSMVTTNGGGNAAFNITFPACVPAGEIVTATATDAAGNTSVFSLNRTVTTIDSGGQGLPDVYVSAHNLPAHSALLDTDGDGMTNLAEFYAGTDPKKPESVFTLSRPSLSPGDATLTLSTVPGHIYRIEYTDSLSPAAWRTLADQLFSAGATLQVSDPGAGALPNRFYRATVVP